MNENQGCLKKQQHIHTLSRNPCTTNLTECLFHYNLLLKLNEDLEDETSQITTKDTPDTATELSKLKREYSWEHAEFIWN